MIANPHQVIFSYWEMVLLVGITRNKTFIAMFNKSWIYVSFTSNKASNVAFITFWEHWCLTIETHCHIWWQSKLYIFIKEHNLSLLTLSISRFISSWCERRLKKVLLSWCIATQRIWFANILTKALSIDKHEYWMGVIKCIT